MKSAKATRDVIPPCRYQPMYCLFWRKRVWAILTRQLDGTWQIVNCLDKDTPCCSLTCAFTTPAGDWPYAAAAVVPPR